MPKRPKFLGKTDEQRQELRVNLMALLRGAALGTVIGIALIAAVEVVFPLILPFVRR